MGRTVPSFRVAEELEVEGWKPFRKALPKSERVGFDDMLSTAKLYASASSSAVRTSKFEGLLIAIIFHHYKTLRRVYRSRPRNEAASDTGVILSDARIMKEIESWRGFADSLRAEDRELFIEMMRACYQYAPSMHAKASPFPSEALFMGLLLLQHKMIAQLVREDEESRKGAER